MIWWPSIHSVINLHSRWVVVELKTGNQFLEGGAPSDDSDLELEDILPAEPEDTLKSCRDEVDLIQIAQDCKRIVDELLDALGQLKVRGPGKKWQCFRVTLERIWKPEQLTRCQR